MAAREINRGIIWGMSARRVRPDATKRHIPLMHHPAAHIDEHSPRAAEHAEGKAITRLIRYVDLADRKRRKVLVGNLVRFSSLVPGCTACESALNKGRRREIKVNDRRAQQETERGQTKQEQAKAKVRCLHAKSTITMRRRDKIDAFCSV